MAAISAIADVMNFAGPKWMSYCRLPLLTIHYCELTSKFCLNFVCFISSATSLDYFCITLVQMVMKMKTVGDKVVVHSLAYLSVWKWLVGTSPSTRKFGRYWLTPLQKERVQLTLIGSPLCAFQCAYDEHRTLSLSPSNGAENRKTAVFRVKSHFTWRKSATKFLCV